MSNRYVYEIQQPDGRLQHVMCRSMDSAIQHATIEARSFSDTDQADVDRHKTMSFVTAKRGGEMRMWTIHRRPVI